VNSPSSVSDLLHKATRQLESHTDSARLDAELLLCTVLVKPREYLYSWSEKATTYQQQTEYQSLIEKRIAGVPLAYLTGEKEFWSHTFKGSGAIAISVAKEIPGIEVFACDNSNAALAVAAANARRLNANINFLQSDWFNNIPMQKFPVIASNPPYVAADDPHLLPISLLLLTVHQTIFLQVAGC